MTDDECLKIEDAIEGMDTIEILPGEGVWNGINYKGLIEITIGGDGTEMVMITKENARKIGEYLIKLADRRD